MIGLREDQQVRAQLIGKINALFFVVNGLPVASPLATISPLATGSGLASRQARPAAGSQTSTAAG